MAITYTWKVKGIKTKDEGENIKAIVQTYWEKIGVDENGNEGRFIGATPFSAADVPAEEFIPFEQLNENLVLDWIKAKVVGPYEEHVNQQIQKQIDEHINAAVDAELPWKTEE